MNLFTSQLLVSAGKVRVACLLLMLVCRFPVEAANIDSLFADVPASVLSIIDHTSRLDMLDLYNHGMEAKAENIYGGQSQMTYKGRSCLLIRTSEVGTWQMKLLNTGKDTIISCISSIQAGGTGSCITFHQLNWKPLKIQFPQPSLELFFSDQDHSATALSKNYSLPSILHEAPIRAMWDNNMQVLTYSVSVEGLSMEDQERIKNRLHSVSYIWMNGRFVLQSATQSKALAVTFGY